MDTIQKLAKNTLALFAGQIINSVLSILLSISLARNLGDVVLGKYSFATSFTAFFAVFWELGYNTLLIREVARNKSLAGSYLNNILSIRAILSVLVITFMVLIINIMGYPTDTKIVVYIFSFYMALVSLSDIFKVTFRAFEKMEYEAGIKIFVNIIRISCGLLVLFLGYGLIELALVFLFSGIFEFLLSFLICEKKFIKSKTEFDFNFWKKSFKIALPLAMLSFFHIIFVRVDIIMLSIMKGDAIVGWYGAAYGLTYGFKPLPQIFMNALLPLIAYYHVSSKKSLKIAYERSFKYLLILGLPLAFGTTLLADRIIILLYGQQFSNSIIALQILAWDVLLIFLYTCSAFIIVSIDEQNKMAIIAGCTALINVVINLILIPEYSYVGAAIATIVAESFLLVSYTYIISRHLYILPVHKMILKPVIACIVMVLFIYLFGGINLILLILISVILYFGVLFLLKEFSSEELHMFKKLIKR